MRQIMFCQMNETIKSQKADTKINSKLFYIDRMLFMKHIICLIVIENK